MHPSDALLETNVRAFLRAIRLGEGTADGDGYRRIVGGALFDSFDDHPRKRVWIERYKVWSTAAGAYQFIAGTWDEMRAKYKLPDFSPHSQDVAAVGLLIRRTALDDVLAGRIEEAIDKCRLEWASLPGSPYGQRTESMQRVLVEYVKHGGAFATQHADQTPMASAPAPEPIAPPSPVTPIHIPDDAPAAPIVESIPVFVRKEPMAPFIAAALPALVQAIPGLIRQFGSGEVTERNAKAAEAVVQIVQQATGAANAQAAVEAVTADPAARVAATEALEREMWFEATEPGEGVAAARDFNRDIAEAGVSVFRMPAFWITILLLPLAYMVVGSVLFVDGASDEMKALVIGAIVSGVLAAITGFWLGTSMQAARR